jgi:hypothetical protein
MSLSANSTEIIELARRPSADKGKTQHSQGRAIRYVESEMRVTDALQAACAEMRSYRMAALSNEKRLVRVRDREGNHVGGADLEDGNPINSKVNTASHPTHSTRTRPRPLMVADNLTWVQDPRWG